MKGSRTAKGIALLMGMLMLLASCNTNDASSIYASQSLEESSSTESSFQSSNASSWSQDSVLPIDEAERAVRDYIGGTEWDVTGKGMTTDANGTFYYVVGEYDATDFDLNSPIRQYYVQIQTGEVLDKIVDAGNMISLLDAFDALSLRFGAEGGEHFTWSGARIKDGRLFFDMKGYHDMGTHNATFGWFIVDAATGEAYEIDMEGTVIP